MNRIHDAFSEILSMLEHGHRSLSPYDIERMYKVCPKSNENDFKKIY